MTVNTSSLHDIWDAQFWGPVTATLDWCEANYQFSRYIAELVNTVSNFITLAFAVYGASIVNSAQLPGRYITGWIGFALVGLGSFIFHATLRYSAQLMDELPMIYVASYCCAVLFDTQPGYDLTNIKTKSIFILSAVFNVLFTWSYAVYRNPIYHQAVFASIMFTTAFRTYHILSSSDPVSRTAAKYHIPLHCKKTVASLFLTGAFTFAFGFFVWNLDNIFCGTVTRWKHGLGWPVAFLLEGHSWWHIFTAAGTYLMLIGNTCTTLGVKDDFANYKITYKWGVLPGIERTAKGRSAIQHTQRDSKKVL
ncbi:alkaline phytoceramidase [Irpex rosettiformis]|uniref:Alkaline phytoceramidase n=1 Tax=Irpex rosettiformis TaxID=378272 RepID=A0ACB8UL51_9APHY|nr:alkaline phytoceramidase [Irpex rosettiformis]